MLRWITHASLDKAEMVGCGEAVPVIQGYELDEYIHCLDLHAEAGTIRPYMAVGSMCRRISDTELERLIAGIWKHASSLGVKRLHYFGLKLTPKLIELDPFIYSRDSAVSYDSYSSEIRAKRNGRRWPRGQAEKRESIESFLSRVVMKRPTLILILILFLITVVPFVVYMIYGSTFGW